MAGCSLFYVSHNESGTCTKSPPFWVGVTRVFEPRKFEPETESLTKDYKFIWWLISRDTEAQILWVDS